MTMTGGTGSGPIIGLGGVVGDVWALKDNGELFRSTGGAFSLQDTFSGGVRGLAVSDDAIVVVKFRGVMHCPRGTCTALADYTEFNLVSLGLDSHAACVGPAGRLVFIASDTSSMARYFERDGGTWVDQGAVGLRYPRSCWFGSDGSLVISGEEKLVRVSEGAATPEQITAPSSGITFHGGAEVGGVSLVAGSGGKVAVRDGGWELLPTVSTNTLFAVGGLRGDELFALGSFQSSAGNGYVWNGASLRTVGALLPGLTTSSVVRSIHPAGPNELYVGGETGTGPVLLRGRR